MGTAALTLWIFQGVHHWLAGRRLGALLADNRRFVVGGAAVGGAAVLFCVRPLADKRRFVLEGAVSGAAAGGAAVMFVGPLSIAGAG
jgi:hypothetical protein